MSWAFPRARRAWPSPSWRAGPARRFFKRGDIVLEINGVAIEDVEALNGPCLRATRRLWRIAINRGGRILKIAVGG